jgi:hypothetical protein
MLVLCYGITKSGSTLTFELVKGMLESAGHPQVRLPDHAVNPGHRVNYIQPITNRRLDDLCTTVGDQLIAVKTHAALLDPVFQQAEDLQRRGQLQVIASWRDPRDICLSLVDAGKSARVSGRREFSLMTDVHVAAYEVMSQIQKFIKWAALEGTLTLEYDTVAFSPEAAIDRIESILGITCDRDQAMRYAFEEAFTQKNKGERNRFQNELNEDEKLALEKRFQIFLQRMYEGDAVQWFAQEREDILRRCRDKDAEPRRGARNRRRLTAWTSAIR